MKSTPAQADWAFPNSATQPGSSAYYSVRFSAPARRNELAALLAWHAQIRAVLDQCHDVGVARLKLQWWREEIQRAAEGKAQHPLAQALSPGIRRWRLPVDSFAAIIEHTESQVRGQQAQTLDDLQTGAENDLGQVFELFGRCHGVDDRQRLDAFRRLGGFCALVYLMRDLGQHLRRDYNPLSADLPGHSTTQLDGDYAAALAALARFTRERHARNPDFQQTPPALSVRAAILQALLNELEGAEFAVANQRICLTPLRKLWIGWRTSRRSAGAGR